MEMFKDLSLQELLKVKHLYGNDALFNIELGKRYIDAGNLAEATNCAKYVLSNDNCSTDALLLLANIRNVVRMNMTLL
jgi:Tfp pilus assembly protein PilF